MIINRLIRLITQGALALILLISPVGDGTNSFSTAHPKIHTEWVSAVRLKQVVVNRKDNYNKKKYYTGQHQPPLYLLVAAGKLKSQLPQQQNFSPPRTQLQKTIPYGTEDELTA